MLKKLCVILIFMLLTISVFNTVNAANLRTTLEVIQANGETKELKNEQGYISKSIIDSNPTTGEVILQIELKNNSNTMRNIKISDVFPKEIINNFEFSYVENQNVGIISDSIDSKTQSISWTIESLGKDESAIVKYKLKIKDMQNENLLNKTISTNEKLTLIYIDSSWKEHSITLNNSPKINLAEIKTSPNASISYNPTSDGTETIVIIKMNKVVTKTPGWILSSDGTTLSKTYYANTIENVKIIDKDGMTTTLTVKVTGMESDNTVSTKKRNTKKDSTTADEPLPQAGINITIVMACIAIIIIAGAIFKMYNDYKDIN